MIRGLLPSQVKEKESANKAKQFTERKTGIVFRTIKRVSGYVTRLTLTHIARLSETRAILE